MNAPLTQPEIDCLSMNMTLANIVEAAVKRGYTLANCGCEVAIVPLPLAEGWRKVAVRVKQ